MSVEDTKNDTGTYVKQAKMINVQIHSEIPQIVIGIDMHFDLISTFPGIQGSLERLQLSYVDVVLANKVDPLCPMEGI